MDISKNVRIYLGLNAVFSLISGTVFLFGALHVTGVLFTVPAAWQVLSLRILGVGLVVFSIVLIIMASNRFVTRSEVMLILAMDMAWVLVSLFLLAFTEQLFSGSGKVAILLVALVVLCFACLQYVGATKLVAPLSFASVRVVGDKLLANVSRKVNAPPNVVWQVMTDHPSYADVADNISRVEVVSGEGVGMLRRCYGLKGENWLESCDLYDEGRAYGFRVHTEAPDYPYPFSSLQGRWAVASQDNDSEFSIVIAAEPNGNKLAQLVFNTIAKRQFKAVLIDLADAWAIRMEHQSQDIS